MKYYNLLFFFFLSFNISAQENSVWNPLKTGAGGWVTGMDIHPSGSPIYARVDVASAYRYNANTNDWTNIVTSNSMPEEDVYWNKIQGVLSIVSAPSNADVAYMAFYNGIYKSTNQGNTWIKTNLPEMEMSPNNDESKLSGERLAVDPLDAQHVLFGSINNGLWRTTNGGDSWQEITSVPLGAVDRGIRQVLFDPSSEAVNGLTSGIYVFPDEDEVHKSTNAGGSFQSIGGVGQNTQYLDMIISSQGEVYISGQDPNGIEIGVYTYKNNTWSQVFDGQGYVIGELALDPFNENRLFVFSFGFEEIWKSMNVKDLNPTWESIGNQKTSSGIPWLSWSFNNWFSIGEILFDPIQEGRLWWADGVGTWTSDNLDDSVITLEERSVGQEHLVSNDLVELSGGRVVTAHWDRPLFYHEDLDEYPAIHQPSSRFNSSWDIDKSPTDENFLVAVIEDHRYCCFDDDTRASGYSTDGGQTWTQFESMPEGEFDLIFGKIVVSANDNSNLVWLGEFGRLPYYTTDMGQTWTQSVLPGVSPDCCLNGYWFKRSALTADQVLPNTFYLYDWGAGNVFKSSDGGATWVKYSEVLRPWAFNGKIMAVPGKAEHLLFTSGPEDAIDWITGLSISEDGGQTFTEMTNTDEVLNVAVGETAPGGTYPTIFIYGRVDGVKGYHLSIDKGVKWSFLGDHPLGIYEWPSVMEGDMDEYGKFYVGTNGTGFYYHELEESTNDCTNQVIEENSFDSGFGLWNDGGRNCRRVAREANSGRFSIMLRGRTNSSFMTTDALDLSSFESIELDFNYIVRSFDNPTEDFWFQISQDGSTFETIEEWNLGDEFENDERMFEGINLEGPFSDNVRFRFRCHASGVKDWVYIDDVHISGCGDGADQSIVLMNPTNEFNSKDPADVIIYPNPSSGAFRIQLESSSSILTQLEIFSISGRQVHTQNVQFIKGQQEIELNLNGLTKGIYILKIPLDDQLISQKIIIE